MAESSKLELILLAKDKMSPALQRLLSLLKKTEKEGKSSTDALDKLTKKLERAPKSDGLKKHNAEIKKTATVAGEAAKAEEKLNNARKRGVTAGKSGREISDRMKLASATEKAAAAEEKLNRARGKRGADGRLRDSHGKYASDGNRPSSGGKRGGAGSFEDDLISGGTGAGLLWGSKKGMGAAMSQQEAFTDIYNSFYRSSLSAGEMNGQMEKAEEISIRLGNKLKGNTADFANMLSTMKQNGMEATTILDGAGEAAAYLAVANREDYSEVGKNYAQFGQLFGVKGKEDNLKIADLMSRAKGKGISSEDLITASKYFGGRTAKTMGLNGTKGAEETLRFMTFIKQNTALDASSVGTGSSAFFRAFTKDELKKNPIIPEMEKKTGVKLDLFDDKGKFKGLENAVAKFAQLKGKLSDKESLQFGQELAGDEGAAVLGAMIDAGNTYQKANQDIDQMASMMTKAAKESDNLSNKVESLGGSLENLGAAGFQPLIAPLSKITDKTNTVVGSLTDMAKAYPTTAATTAGVLTLGGAFLTLKGGSGVLSRLTSLTGGVGNEAENASKKVGKLRGSLGSISGAFKVLLLVELLGATWEQITTLRQTVEDWKKTQNNINTGSADLTKAYKSSDEAGVAPDHKQRANDAMFALQGFNKDLSKALDPSKMGWHEWFGRGIGSLVGKDTNPAIFQGKPTTTDILKNEQSYARVQEVSKLPMKQQTVEGTFRDAYERVAAEIASVKNLQDRAPMLDNPNTMTAFRRDAMPAMGLSDVKKQFLDQMLQSAFPASFAQSNQQLATGQENLIQQTSGLSQTFLSLIQPSSDLGTGFSNLNTNSNNAVTGVNNLATATNNAASRINNIQITPPTFAPISIPIFNQSPNPAPNIFGRARGGSVRRGNPYEIGEVGKELFIPETNGRVISNDILRRKNQTGASVHINFNPTVTVNSDNPNAELILGQVRRELAILKSEIVSEFSPDRLAQKVEWAAQRDSERI